MNGLFREEDREQGIAFCRDPVQFKVIMSTRFGPDDFQEYLFDESYGLLKGKELYSFIVVKSDDEIAALEAAGASPSGVSVPTADAVPTETPAETPSETPDPAETPAETPAPAAAE